MKKIMVVAVMVMAVVGFATIAYSGCGICAEEETQMTEDMMEEYVCTNPDCTPENPCDACKAAMGMEDVTDGLVCTNPDCTPENPCDACKAKAAEMMEEIEE